MTLAKADPAKAKAVKPKPTVTVAKKGELKANAIPKTASKADAPPDNFLVQLDGNSFTVFGENAVDPKIDIGTIASLAPPPVSDDPAVCTVAKPNGVSCGFTPKAAGTCGIAATIAANDGSWTYPFTLPLTVKDDLSVECGAPAAAGDTGTAKPEGWVLAAPEPKAEPVPAFASAK
jgi:hypothetical protein